MSIALPLGVLMWAGADEAVRWDRVFGAPSRPVPNAYTSSCVFGGVRALVVSALAHELLWRGEVGTDDWFARVQRLGANFLFWEALDLAFIARHGIATPDAVFHHVAHLLMAPWMAMRDRAWFYVGLRLLLQETSNVPLNAFLLLRHRQPRLSKALFVAFAALFFAYRIANATQLLLYETRGEPLMRAGMLPTYCLQWWWFVKIVRAVARRA